MTILYSFYSAQGIIFAADSQITARGERVARPSQPKVLPIPHLGVAREGGLIGYFGLAQVRGTPMADWLRDVIARRPMSPHVGDFSGYLVSCISQDATRRELKEACGFHIGAFEKSGSLTIPVFHFVRNIRTLRPDGTYTDVDTFIHEEQLIARDFASVPVARVRQRLRQREQARGFPHWYRNGDLPNFGPITSLLEEAVAALVSRRVGGFRPPATADGWRMLARTMMTTVSNLYKVYQTDTAPSVGRRAVVKVINWPS